MDDLNRLLDHAIAAAKLQSAASEVPASSVESRNVGSGPDSKPLARVLLSELDSAAYPGYSMAHAPGVGGSADEAGQSQVVSMGSIVRPITNATTRIMVPEKALKNFIGVCKTVFGVQVSFSPVISYDQLKYMKRIWDYAEDRYQTQLAESGVMGSMPVSHSGSLLLEGNSRPVNHDAVKPTVSPAVTGDVDRKEAKDKASSKRSAQATESRSMIQKIVHVITWPLRAVWGLLMVIFSPIIGLFSSSKSSCGSEVGCCDYHPASSNNFSPSSPIGGNVHHKSSPGSADLEAGLSVTP